MTEISLVDRVVIAIARVRGVSHAASLEDIRSAFGFRIFDEAQAAVQAAVQAIREGNSPTAEIANDQPAPTRPGQIAPLRFPLRPGAAVSGVSAERGAVPGMPGWFWWEQVQPPPGRTIDYCDQSNPDAIHRVPSHQSPVSLQGKMWRLAP